jgi:hypothetical protein
MECVYWEVGNESLNKIQVDNNTLEKVNITASGTNSNHWTI